MSNVFFGIALCLAIIFAIVSAVAINDLTYTREVLGIGFAILSSFLMVRLA